MTDLEYEQLVAGTPCPNCGENLDIRNVTKTIEVSTFGNLGRKMRLVRCLVCGKEHQFLSDK